MRRNRRRASPDLFAAIGHNQPPTRIRGEPARFYAGVLFLRIYCNRSVYRVGAEHRVSNRQLSTRQLEQLVAAETRRMTGKEEMPVYVLHRLGFPLAFEAGRP